jgi:hypothetical protein
MKMRSALLCLLAPLLLSGCGGEDDDGGTGNAFLDIFAQDRNAEPVPVGDGDSLRSAMEDLFGGPNDDPQEPDVL